MSRAPLDVWLYGTHAATLREPAVERLELVWTEAATQRWGTGTRVLSAMLPVGAAAPSALVRAWVDGLLPEGAARVNAALDAGVPPDDTFALVRAYGADTPGAAVFVAPGSPDPTRTGRYEPLTDDDVAGRLRLADVHAPAGRGRVAESSTLPGMVPKITLHREGGTWFACKDGAPSTWILKRAEPVGSPLGDVADTEVACLDLARRVGLTTIDAELLVLGDVRAVAVSRYDRGPADPAVRVHQEDLAQALGLSTSDPNRKFQWGSRMPSLEAAARVLRLDGARPDGLLRLVTFSLLVGNTDLHAKNISFLRPSDGSVLLAPVYDVAMHLHHPRAERRFALDLDGEHRLGTLTVEHVVAEGRRWGLPERRARAAVAGTVDALGQALRDVDRDAHPGVTGEAWAVVDQRVGEAGRRLAGTTARQGDPRRTDPRRRGPRRPG